MRMGFALKFVGGIVIVGAIWWSMARLVWSSDLFQSSIGGTMAQARFLDGEALSFDHGNFCCSDFDAGLAWSFVAAVLGGFPIAITAIVLRRRMRFGVIPPPWSEPFLLAAFVMQFASLIVNLLLTLLLLGDPADIISHPGSAYIVVVAVLSAVALPMWHTLRQAVASQQYVSEGRG